jgi:tetraacyldisaccharide 4'-kinase
VGNLSVGGSGKTPVVARVARLLMTAGERPAILTRGYARRHALEGITVVSDGVAVLADVGTAGDEPLMLGRALPGVRVLVASDRYLAGRLAEQQMGATVHVLDDGFQHHGLARDVDLLLADEQDVRDRPLPAGRLREPLACARGADAVLVTAADDEAAGRVGQALSVATVFRVRRSIGMPLAIGTGVGGSLDPGSRVFAFAAIARPQRFFDDLRAAGWEVTGTSVFRDHHDFSRADLDRVFAAARAAGADAVLTTEKDAVRLERHALKEPVGAVPLHVDVEPAAAFEQWLIGRVTAAHLGRRECCS